MDRRLARLLRALVPIGGAGILLAAFSGVVPLNHLQDGGYRTYGRLWRDRISLEEIILYAAVVFLAAPATLLLGRALADVAGKHVSRLVALLARRPRWTLGACIVGVLAASVISGFFLVQHSPITDEQQTLVFQAELLQRGHLSERASNVLSGMEPGSIVQRGNQWTAEGQWGHAAVLAAGAALGSPFIFPHLMAGLLVLLTWLLGRELFPADRHARLVAAVVLATSPFLILTSATLAPSVTSSFCTLAGAFALTRHVRRDALVWALVAGLAFGFGLHVRPVSAAAMGGVCLGLALAGRLAERRSLVLTVLAVLVGLIPAAAVHWQLARLGFSTYMPICGDVPTFANIGRAFSDVLRFGLWISGSALTTVAVLFAGTGWSRRRSDGLLLLPPLALFIAAIGWDRSPQMETGPAAYLDALPFVALFIGRVASATHERIGPAARHLMAALVLVSVVVAGLTFWPTQAKGLYTTSESVVKPYRYVKEVGLRNAFALWHKPEPARSWVTQPVPPLPDGSDPVIFVPPTEVDWMERMRAGKRHVLGRRPYNILQTWGDVSLSALRTVEPPVRVEPICREPILCEPDPRQSTRDPR